MKAERLFRVMNLVDEELIEEMAEVPEKAPVWKRYAAVAACVGLVWLAGFAWFTMGGFGGFGAAAPSDGTSAGGTGIAHESEPVGVGNAVQFMSYAGPVLPLTTAAEVPGITAERHTDWDFSLTVYQNGEPRQWGAGVTDSYTLTNTTDTKVTLELMYPITASLSDLGEEMAPQMTLNGETVEWGLTVGDYAGGFRDAGVEDGSTWNLAYPDSWTDYQTLLEGGDYRAAALAETEPLTQPVTVYAFSEFEAPHEQYDAATQAVICSIDPARTTVLTYGFNGYSCDEDSGTVIFDYFVPNGVRHDGDTKQLIVLGDDLGEYKLQGYENGACEREIEGVSCTVTRTETTLHAALLALCDSCLADIASDPDYYAWLSGATEVLEAKYNCALVERVLTGYGILAETPVDRYANGRLDEVLSEVLTVDRVLYLTAEVTLSGGETVEVAARYWKSPSFDFGGSGSEFIGLQGYDLTTVLDSTLRFTAQTVSLSHAESIEITGQNFGFDLENGVTEVTIDQKTPHYYLEIRPREAAEK